MMPCWFIIGKQPFIGGRYFCVASTFRVCKYRQFFAPSSTRSSLLVGRPIGDCGSRNCVPFGTKLVQLGFDGAQYITPLVFAVVLVTVLLNATTARLFASVVGVF